jgi:AraC-like DNA-binding protein
MIFASGHDVVAFVNACQAAVGHICLGRASRGLRLLSRALLCVPPAAWQPAARLLTGVTLDVFSQLHVRGYGVPRLDSSTVNDLLASSQLEQRFSLLCALVAPSDPVLWEALSTEYRALNRRFGRVGPPASFVGTDAAPVAAQPAGPEALARARKRAYRLLRNLLADPSASVPRFLVCAAALRRVSEAATVLDVEQAVHSLRAGWRQPAGFTPMVAYAIALIQKAVAASNPRVTERDVTRRLGVSCSTLAHAFQRDTGMSFRSWRSAAAIQQSVLHLLTSDEQVAQIGYRIGFQHPSQLNREFGRLLRVTPTQLRALLHD